MSDETVRVRRSDMLREAIRAEKRRMLARVSGESGPQRERLLREIAAANELITWFEARGARSIDADTDGTNYKSPSCP